MRAPQRHIPSALARHGRWTFLAVLVWTLWTSASASAVELTLTATSSPYPGVVVEEYRTTLPSTNAVVARIDLCTAGVWVDATSSPSGLQTAGAWASARGVQVAINADFYATTPALHVYGQAVGDGVAWPSLQTGIDDAYAAQWFY